jgi:hypothetical protein
MLYSPRQQRRIEDDVVDLDLEGGYTLQPLRAVATSQGILRAQGMDTVLYYDYAFRGTVSTVRLHLWISRAARIQDRIIQLYWADSLQGQNMARASAADQEIYQFQGSYNITEDFGVAIDLQPHRSYPSMTTAYIRQVKMEFIQ